MPAVPSEVQLVLWRDYNAFHVLILCAYPHGQYYKFGLANGGSFQIVAQINLLNLHDV